MRCPGNCDPGEYMACEHGMRAEDEIMTETEYIEIARTHGTTHAEVAEAHLSRVRRMLKGNAPSAIRLFCIACFGGNSREATSCPEKGCPLWHYRKGKNEAPNRTKRDGGSSEGLRRWRESQAAGDKE